MALTISRELEEKINRAAQERGVEPNGWAQEVLLRETNFHSPRPRLTLTVEEFLVEVGRIGKNLPTLPDYAYTRESFYEDHD